MAKRLTNRVVIVGCGPGGMGHITLKALRRIQEADVLVGSKRLLSLFPEVNAEKFILSRNYKPLITKIAARSRTKKVIVLVSGDPGFFSYARLVVGKLGRENCEIIPGISSVQLAFASIGKSWSDAHFLSLHGRPSELETLVEAVKNYNKVAILNDSDITPRVICHTLQKKGINVRKVYLCENLSLSNERIREFDLASLSRVDADNLNVIIILKEAQV